MGILAIPAIKLRQGATRVSRSVKGTGSAGKVLSTLAFLAAAAALLIFPAETCGSMKSSLSVCLSTLVPSLFPFMVLTGFAVDSGVGEAAGRWLGPAVRRIFRLPDCCAAPILMSFLGGYPAGAKGVSLLLERGRISTEQAARMMLFCVCPGPAFTVTFIGAGVLEDLRAGWLLLTAVTAAGLLLGFLTGLGKPVPEKQPPESGPSPSGVLIRSVSGAAKSMVIMCSCIVLFSALAAVLRGSGLFGLLCRGLAAASPLTREDASVLLSFLLEVTSGVEEAAQMRAEPVFFAFGLAFGGLCVHWQLFSFFSEFPGRKRVFLLFRLFHGLLAAAAGLLLIRFLPGDPFGASSIETWAATNGVKDISPLSGTLMGGVSLLLMCLAFLTITAERDGA